MKAFAVLLGFVVAFWVGAQVQRHVSVDCTPWLDNIKMCAAVASK